MSGDRPAVEVSLSSSRLYIHANPRSLAHRVSLPTKIAQSLPSRTSRSPLATLLDLHETSIRWGMAEFHKEQGRIRKACAFELERHTQPYWSIDVCMPHGATLLSSILKHRNRWLGSQEGVQELEWKTVLSL